MTDYFTKFATMIKLPDQTAVAYAQQLSRAIEDLRFALEDAGFLNTANMDADTQANVARRLRNEEGHDKAVVEDALTMANDEPSIIEQPPIGHDKAVVEAALTMANDEPSIIEQPLLNIGPVDDKTPAIIVEDDESGDPYTAGYFIQHLLQKYDLPPHGFEWSEDASRPITDEAYGGGYVVVTQDDVHVQSTNLMLQDKITVELQAHQNRKLIETAGLEVREDPDQPGLYLYDGANQSDTYDAAVRALANEVRETAMAAENLSDEDWDKLSFEQQLEQVHAAYNDANPSPGI